MRLQGLQNASPLGVEVTHHLQVLAQVLQGFLAELRVICAIIALAQAQVPRPSTHVCTARACAVPEGAVAQQPGRRLD